MKKKTKTTQTKKKNTKTTKMPVKKINRNSKPEEKENKKSNQEHPMSTNKKYTGTLTLNWYNKQKSILVDKEESKSNSDIPAPKINWVNREDSVFFEINDEEGKGLEPYWVDRNDIRVKEARPLIFKKIFMADEKKSKNGDLKFELKESSKDDESVQNILIKGDNLLALNSLAKHFENKPDEEKPRCVFIDPPYNTGYAFNQYEDNMEHSMWLSMMRDRLLLLRRILSDAGSIWITLDDNESHYMKILCDEIFGRINFLGNIVWQSKDTPGNNSSGIAQTHNHILAYRKTSEFGPSLLERNEDQVASYTNPDNDKRGPWLATPLTRAEFRERDFYELTNPVGKKVFPPKGSSWRRPPEKIKELIKDNRIYWGVKGDSEFPSEKKFLSEVKSGVVNQTWWPYEFAGSTRNASAEMKSIFDGKKAFDTPKPEKLIKRILDLATAPDDIVIDTFLGSGTTPAVAHKMGRKWIGIEIGEHADVLIVPRMKKVISGEDQGGISEDVEWKGGGSFKYYHLGPSIISNKKGDKDFNWKLGKKTIEESLLSSYDYIQDLEFEFPKNNLFKNEDSRPAIGVQKISSKTRVAIISLQSPDEKSTSISFEEISSLYELVKSKYGPEYINIFTNRGVDISSDSRPEDLEIIKVPHAIFAELEK